jgi:hypothetical protein
MLDEVPDPPVTAFPVGPIQPRGAMEADGEKLMALESLVSIGAKFHVEPSEQRAAESAEFVRHSPSVRTRSHGAYPRAYLSDKTGPLAGRFDSGQAHSSELVSALRVRSSGRPGAERAVAEEPDVGVEQECSRRVTG